MDYRRIAIEAELSEARGAQLCIAHARTALPHRDACSLAVAGGYANFLGPRSPLSEAVGVGVAESAGIADVDRIVEFYIARGSVPRVACGPHVDRALVEALRARG
ncbi:MAG: hypothetical protein KGN02_08905, partial [bacterium]|nr:hypothetical protein [bacterium]